MSFTYAFKTTPAYVEITLTGVMDNINGVNDFGKAVREYIADMQVEHILVDERKLTHRLSKKDLLTVAENMAAKYSSIKKFALAGSREDAKQRDLFAGFATAMNFRMCSFENIEEAKHWLINA